MTRKFLRSIGLALVGVLLFAQMAIASYACPALASPMRMSMQMPMQMKTPLAEPSTEVLTKTALPAEGLQAMNCEDMAGAVDNSYATPNGTLCAEHCHFGQHSNDAPTVNVPVAMMALLYFTPPALDQPNVARTAAGRPAVLAAAVAPPHAILHCCLRI